MICPNRTKTMCLALLLSISSFNLFAGLKFVSPNGNNSNLGTEVNPFLTITYAIQQAAEFDTVIMLPGVYSEQLNITKSLTISSKGIIDVANINTYIDNTIFSGSGATTQITFNSNFSKQLVLYGFSIKDCTSQVLNISSTNNSKIDRMKFINNGNIGNSVINIYGNVNVTNSYFKNNKFSNLIYIITAGNGFSSVNTCEFVENGLTNQFEKSLIYIYNKAKILNNVIYNNTGAMLNGGCNAPYDTVIVSNNTIVGNNGYGFVIDHCSGGINAFVSNNIIEKNTKGCLHFVSNSSGYSTISLKNNKLNSNPYYTQNPIQYSLTWVNNDTSSVTAFTYPITNISQLNLPSYSTLIGKGINSSLAELTKDFYNNNRPQPAGSNSDIGAIESNLSQPQISMVDSMSICKNNTPLDLISLVNPKTGQFSGNGVYSNKFYPDSVTSGVNKIYYTLSGANWTTTIDSILINVLPIPTFIVTPGVASPYCIGTPVQLTATSVSNATYSWYQKDPVVVNKTKIEVFSTHNADGSQAQYPSLPTSTSSFNAFFDTTFSHTTHVYSGYINETFGLNWGDYTDLTYQNIVIPNNGNFFSVQYSGFFIPTETGLYSFQLGSDDASEFMLNNQVILSSYNGNTSNTVQLVAGQKVPYRIRYHEFNGSEHLWIKWKKPSQSTFQINAEEIESYGPSILQPNQTSTQLNISNPGNYFSQVSLSNGCIVNSNIQPITFNALPTVTLADIQPICNSQTTAISLAGGLPTGGVYSGLGVSNNLLSPNLLPLGKTPLTYTFTDANGCVNSVTKKINKLPGQIALNTTAACYNTPIIATNSDTSSYVITWYKDNVLFKQKFPSYEDTAEILHTNLSAPEDLFVDAAGNKYIVEMGNHRVIRITPSGVLTVVAGGNGQGSGLNQLNNPINVHVDAQQNVFVVDNANHRVMRWANGATTGVIVAGATGIIGTALNRLNGPVGIAFDGQGRMYIGDYGNARVMRYTVGTLNGTIVAGNGTAGSALNQLNQVGRIFIDGSNNLYVGDNGNARVLRFPPNSTSSSLGTKVAGGNGHGVALNQINNPISDIFVDANSNVYISDYVNERIVRWSPNALEGEMVVGGNGYGWELNQVSRPTGLYIDQTGNILVAQRDHQRLLKFSIKNLISDTIIPTNSGIYTVKFEHQQIGCPIMSTDITINKPTVTLTSAAGAYVCDGTSTTLTTYNNTTYTYQWKKDNTVVSGANSNSYVATQAGTYKVIVSDTNGCSDSPKTFTINQLPVVSLTSTGNCLGDTLITNAPDSTISQITWFKDGQVVKTVLPEFNSIGECVANNSQGYGWSGDVHLDNEGQIYFSDGDNHRVLRFNPTDNTYTIVAGGNGQGSALNQLNVPYGIYVDASKNVYISDFNNHRIVKWAPGATAGQVVAGNGTTGSGLNQLNGPTDVLLDAQNRVLVVERNNHRVTRWATPSVGVIVAGQGGIGSGLNQLHNPYNIHLTENNDLFVSDYDNHRVVKYTSNSITGIVVAGGNAQGNSLNQLSGPIGIFVDHSQNIYVSDYNNDRIMRWKKNANSGELLVGGTGGGHLLNQTSNPRGVFLNNNEIYLTTQNYANRVMKFTGYNILLDSLQVTAPGTYKAEFTTYSRCSDDSPAITIYNPISSITSSAGAYVCDGTSTTLTTNNNTTYTYQWKKDNTVVTGANANSYVATQAGTYKVIVSDTNGCADSPKTFTINPLPLVSLTTTGNCLGDTLITNVPDSTTSQITWYKDGQVVKTVLPEFNSIGECVANNSQGYGWSGDVHLDNEGQIYFSDGDNHRVLRFNPTDNTYTIVAGGNGQGSALNQLNVPYGIYVDASKNVFVADYSNHRIVKWALGASSGTIVAGNGTQGSGLNQLSGPTDVLVDSQNRIIVAENNNHRVTRWATASTGVVVAGQGGVGSGLNQLNNPYNLFMTNDDELYISDYSNHRIIRYLPNATSGAVVAGGNGGGNTANKFNGPVGVFVDYKKNIYVSDYNNDRIMRWKKNATTGELVVGGNGGGHLLNQTSNPRGVFLNNNEIYITTYNYANRVMKFSANDIQTDALQVTAPGTYKAEFTTYSRCSDDSPTITIYNPISSMTSSAGTYVCDGSATTLTTNNNSSYTYQWKKNNNVITGANANSYVASQTGTYKVIVADTNGCLVSPSTFTINPLPVATLTSTGNCLGDTLITNAPDSTISQVTWYKDGQVVKTVLQQFNSTGECIANITQGFNWSGDVHLDQDGQIYFSDGENDRVVRYNPQNNSYTVVAGGNGQGSALNQLDEPYGIYVDNFKNVYVADFYNHRIVKWAPGASSGEIVAGGNGQGSALNQLNGPRDVLVDSQSRVLVSDYYNHRVTRWATPTTGVIVAGQGGLGSGLNQLSNPYNLFMTDDEELYISDYGNQRVMRYLPNASTGVKVAGGNGTGAALNKLNGPIGVFVDHKKNLFISDYNNSRIMRWKNNATTGELVVGGNGDGDLLNQTSNPRGIYLKGDEIYITSQTYANKVMKFKAIVIPSVLLQVTTPGVYKAEFSSYSQCSAESSTITIFDPIVTFPSLNSICSTSNSINLNSATPSGGIYSGLGVLNNIFNPSLAGVGSHSISYMFTDTNGCSKTESSTIVVDPIPNVNLNSSDTSYCQGQSVNISVLNNNVTQSYIWYNNGVQQGSTSNQLIINGTNSTTVYAKVTRNTCIAYTDTINVIVNPIPTVSISSLNPTTFCVGDSVKLIATGSPNVSYQWSRNNVLLSQFNDTITTTLNGTYKVKAAFSNGCSSTSNVINIVVHPYPLATITANSPLTICEGSTILMTANTGASISYQWFKDNTIIPSQNQNTLVVADSGNYSLVTTFAGLCSTTSSTLPVVVNPLPVSVINSIGQNQVCAGDTVYLTATNNSSLTYQWFNAPNISLTNQTTQNFNTTVPGNYFVKTTNQFGCSKNSNIIPVLNYTLPQTYQEICAVSVDTSTNSNQIIWEKPIGANRVWYYNIYRETAISGQYGLVGTVLDTALTVYNDVLSNPAVQSYRYKIAHVDSCGLESGKSSLHRTIHLSSNMGINGVVNLSWNQYEGFIYPTHNILRSVNGSTFTSIAQISSNSSTYTDLNPPVGVVNYIIGIDIPNGCSPNKSSSSTLLSNKISVGTASVENYLTSQMEIYPNPSDGLFTLKISDLISNGKNEFEIINSIGQVMYSIEIVNKLETKINLQEYANGVYFIRHKNGNWMEKFIINR